MTLKRKIDWQNKLILAPLTKGGHVPFRRLCESYGADITVSEMAYAFKLVKGDRRERAYIASSPLRYDLRTLPTG